jgi:hypothetical protein
MLLSAQVKINCPRQKSIANFIFVEYFSGGVASKWKCCTQTANYLSSNDEHIVVGAPEDYFNEGDSAKEKKKQQLRLAELQSEFFLQKAL